MQNTNGPSILTVHTDLLAPSVHVSNCVRRATADHRAKGRCVQHFALLIAGAHVRGQTGILALGVDAGHVRLAFAVLPASHWNGQALGEEKIVRIERSVSHSTSSLTPDTHQD